MPIVLSGLPMLAIFAWLASLMIDSGQFPGTSTLLLGAGWLVMTSVATVGLVVAHAMWAWRALLALPVTGLYASLFRPTDASSIIATLLTAGALVALLSPQMSRRTRRLPAPTAPPPRAVIAALLPLGMPLALGLAPVRANGWALIGALLGPATAFLYSRTLPGGLVALRIGLPIMTGALAIPMGLPHGVVALVLVGAGTVIAWNGEVATAFHPLIKRGSTYAIPPELAPVEIRETAGIDETGKRL